MKKGRFVVVDGLDGVGKGVILDTLAQAAKDTGRGVFNVDKYWQEHDRYPQVD
jgi:thymidylate kinase